MKRTPKVFLCSTYSDLKLERAGVLDAVELLQLEGGSMELFGARSDQPISTCLEEVRRSDILVVLVGHRYGSIAPGFNISFTEAEYQEGYKLGKECLIYLKHEAAPIFIKDVEQDPEGLRSLRRWKEVLHQRHTVATFSDAKALAPQVSKDLSRAIQSLQKRRYLARRSGSGSKVSVSAKAAADARSKDQDSNSSQPSALLGSWAGQLARYQSSNLLKPFRLKRNHVHVTLHEDLRIEPTEDERELFKIHNQKRVSAGLERQYADDRVRLLREPRLEKGDLFLDVAPFNYLTFAVLREGILNRAQIQSVEERIAACTLPGAERTEGFDPHRLVPLGTEIVLVTSDQKTLLRRRGASVQTEKSKWDVSASGYVSTKDKLRRTDGGRKIDVSETIRSEVENELDENASGNPASIVFLGVHSNSESGANDILAYWPLSISSSELASFIHERRHEGVRFKTTVEPPEPFVRDTENLIVEFSPPACLSAVTQIHADGDVFMPEALVCLALSLGETG